MKVLIISAVVFPKNSPRANRATELAKEFSRQGHEVLLYGILGEFNYSDFEEKYNIKVGNIGRMRFSSLNSDGNREKGLINKSFSKLFKYWLEFPDFEIIFKISRIFKIEKDIDLLITIAFPYPIHWGAALAKGKSKNEFPKTWVADCGDPYMGNPIHKHPFYFKFIEKWFCRKTDFISVPIEEAKKAYYPEFRNKIRVIPQGFKFDEVKLPKQVPENPVPTFVYAGVFYSTFRDPTLFLEFLITVKDPFKFIIFTKSKQLVEPYKKKLGEKLELRDYIPRNELLLEMSKADFLLNIENENKIQSPSKLIDYFLTGRPILSISSNSFEKEIFMSFLRKDYSKSKIIDDIEKYNIEHIVCEFIKLTKI